MATLFLALPVARADEARTSDEPWYQQSSAEDQRKAQTLFAQAVNKHQQLLRNDAITLYEQALSLWDNPDIRWNLALVLDDVGRYLAAHQQLEHALRWGTALGAERLSKYRERMRVLETQRLARIEAVSSEPGADIKLDGQPWFRGAGRQSMLVLPGSHYIVSTKPGYFPITVSTSVVVGDRYRVALRMIADRLIETRRWSAWKPWGLVVAGLAVVAVSWSLEAQAARDWNHAEDALQNGCDSIKCPPIRPSSYDRARSEDQFAVGVFAAGGTAIVIGLTLALINQPRTHRTEVAPPTIELVPAVSQDRLGISASIRF